MTGSARTFSASSTLGAVALEAIDGSLLFSLGKNELVVGRENADLVVDEPSISRQHAKLTRDAAGAWSVTDLGSRNGTFVDGRQLAAQESTALVPQGRVRFGSKEFVLRTASAAPSRMTTEFSLDQFLPMFAPDTRPTATLMTELVYRAQASLSPLIAPSDLHDLICHLALEFTAATRAAILMLDEGALVPLHSTAPADTAPLMLSRAISDKVMRERKVVLIKDVETDDEFKNRQSLLAQGITSAACAPLFDGGEMLGAVYIDIRGEPKPGGALELLEVDAGVLAVLASMAGLALSSAEVVAGMLREQERLRGELERLQA